MLFSNGNVVIGGGNGLSIASNGIVSFAGGQTFPLPAIGGDVTGSLSNLSVVRLRGTNVSAAIPTPGQVLQFSGGAWAPASIVGGGGGTVTSVASGLGLTATPSPIIATGTLAIDTTVVPQLGASNTFTAANLFGGGLSLPPTGAATISAGFSSNALDLNASSFNNGVGLPINQKFRWQSEAVNNNSANASATLNLLFAVGANTPGETGLSIDHSGVISFAAGQTFPGISGNFVDLSSNQAIGGTKTFTNTITGNISGSAATATNFSGNLGGEVTGTQGATVVTNAVSANTANAIVRRNATGNFAAGTITLSGNVALPTTVSGGTAGVITLGGIRFLHNFGVVVSGSANNTFVGASAGNTNPTLTGSVNTGVGASALSRITTGCCNAAFGFAALGSNTTGFNNDAFGDGALSGLTTGSSNIAIGGSAGNHLAGGESDSIYLDNQGATGESNTIRIGTGQTAAFMAGISGATSAAGVAVLVNSSGQLGTTTSSRRYKEQITDQDGESDVLMKLRPVSFYYKPELDSTHTRQYGLVAEEVAQIAPSLVLFDEHGAPQTVRYHFVNAMLLNEVQKQRRLLEKQQQQLEEDSRQKDAEIAAQAEQIRLLREQVILQAQQMQAITLEVGRLKSARNSQAGAKLVAKE